ncbi:MAG: metal ABC transporter substrate-binding protein [Acidobacteriota bacterium]
MKLRSAATVFAALAILLGAAACSAPEEGAAPAAAGATAPTPSGDGQPALEAPAEPVLRVATLSNPADWLVQRLGAGRIAAEQAMPADARPATWRPTADAVVALQQVDLLVMNGAGYEAWTDQTNLPLSKLLDTSAELDRIEIQGRTHSHGDGGEHSHAGFAAELWLDPDLYLAQARSIHDAFVELDADGAEAYGAALAALETELTGLSAELAATLEPLRGIQWIADHPSFHYFARRFGLTIEALDIDAAAPPSAELLSALAEKSAAGNDASVAVLLTSKPHPDLEAALRDGPAHLVVDTLEVPADGGDYDYLAQMRANRDLFAGLSP